MEVTHHTSAMPELPEVETARRGLEPHVVGRRLLTVEVRERRLRWPVPKDLPKRLVSQRIRSLRRTGKYLLFDLDHGHLLVHFGMTGTLTVHVAPAPPGLHDHVDFTLDSGAILRYHDPRRFGAVLWVGDPTSHRLLTHIGCEPLAPGFSGAMLARLASGKRQPVKAFLMDGRVIAGVGNIYAGEALFAAGVHPSRPAGRISRERWDRIARALVATLTRAIAAGGSTLRDFVGSDGTPGSYQDNHAVYGREGLACPSCGTTIRATRHAGRSTFYCPRCQR